MTTINSALLEALLDTWPVARLATLQADAAAPHQVPIVFCRLADAIYSPLDGKTKDGRELKRFRNIRAHPHVSLLLDDYQADWARLWWVRLDGTAERCTPPPELAGDLAARMRGKYPQYANVPLHRAEPVYVRMTWQRATAWGQVDAESAIRAALGQ